MLTLEELKLKAENTKHKVRSIYTMSATVESLVGINLIERCKVTNMQYRARSLDIDENKGYSIKEYNYLIDENVEYFDQILGLVTVKYDECLSLYRKECTRLISILTPLYEQVYSAEICQGADYSVIKWYREMLNPVTDVPLFRYEELLLHLHKKLMGNNSAKFNKLFDNLDYKEESFTIKTMDSF